MPPKQPQNQAYSAKNIQFLSPREHIRKRPGMYIGGTDKRAFHNLLWEVVDDIIAEATSGKSPCNQVTITLSGNTTIKISDNGVGIPVHAHNTGRSILEIHLTETFGRDDILKEKSLRSGGLMGVGIRAVTALSSRLVAGVKRDGFLWRQTYQEGMPITQVERIRPLEAGESTGTSITFTPDFTIMEDGLTFDYELIVGRCRELAYMLPQVTFRIERDDKSDILNAPAGIRDWIVDVNADVATLHPVLYKDFSSEFEDKSNRKYTVRVELAFQFRTLETGDIKAFVNTIAIPDGGTHLEGLTESLLTAIYGDAYSELIAPINGLVAILHIYHPDPQFRSQTQVELLNPEVKDAVRDCVGALLAENMEIHAQLQGYFRI